MMNEKVPENWTEEEISAIAEYYDNQTEDEAIAEAEAAYSDPNSAMVQIPHELLPEVLQLLAEYEAKRLKKARRK